MSKPPSDAVRTFVSWIAHYANRHNLAVIAIVADRGEDKPVAVTINGGDRNFSLTAAHALMSQPDIAQLLAEAALERLAGHEVAVQEFPLIDERS